MQIEDRTEEHKACAENCDLINGLVKSAFGFAWKGNYNLHGFQDPSLIQAEKPMFIARYPLWESLTGNYTIAGQLSYEIPGTSTIFDADGSVIAVSSKYKSQAIKYAVLYKEKIGKEPKVMIINTLDIGRSKNHGFVARTSM